MEQYTHSDIRTAVRVENRGKKRHKRVVADRFSSVRFLAMELLTTIYNYPSEFKYVSGETPMTHWSYPVVIGALYMTTILGLRAIMNKAPNRIEARWFAAVHNWNMYAVSVACFFGITYGTIKLAWVRFGLLPNLVFIYHKYPSTRPNSVVLASVLT